jgi:hypothetical protein
MAYEQGKETQIQWLVVQTFWLASLAYPVGSE